MFAVNLKLLQNGVLVNRLCLSASVYDSSRPLRILGNDMQLPNPDRGFRSRITRKPDIENPVRAEILSCRFRNATRSAMRR
jgi:hypothetical protein